MTAQTIVGSLPAAPSLPIRERSHEVAGDLQVDAINPSRSITTKDEVYLRDYAIAAAVISWDECTYGTPAQLTAADITNIAIAGDTVWYQIEFHRAIPLNIEIFHAHRQRIPLHQAQTEQAEPQQPANSTEDWAAHQLQPDWEALAEYESGCTHGKHDAASRMSPMCKQANCPYSHGYLDGYKSINTDSQQPAQISKAIEWKVVHDPRWDVYQVWVENRCLREKASNYEQGERIAQKYIAAEELRLSHRELVMTAFAG